MKAVAGVVDGVVIDAQVCMTVDIRQLELLAASEVRCYMPKSTTDTLLSDGLVLSWGEHTGSSDDTAACIGDATTDIEVVLIADFEDTLAQLDLIGELTFEFM